MRKWRLIGLYSFNTVTFLGCAFAFAALSVRHPKLTLFQDGTGGVLAATAWQVVVSQADIRELALEHAQCTVEFARF